MRILDRFLMYYIHTADRLMRTARWVEQFEGGIDVGYVPFASHTQLTFSAETKEDLIGR